MKFYNLHFYDDKNGFSIVIKTNITSEENIIDAMISQELLDVEEGLDYSITETNEEDFIAFGEGVVLDTFAMERQEVIDKLVDNEEDTILQDAKAGDTSVLDSMIRYGGILGFDNMTNEDLITEYYDKFDVKIIIE